MLVKTFSGHSCLVAIVAMATICLAPWTTAAPLFDQTTIVDTDIVDSYNNVQNTNTNFNSQATSATAVNGGTVIGTGAPGYPAGAQSVVPVSSNSYRGKNYPASVPMALRPGQVVSQTMPVTFGGVQEGYLN